LLKFDRYPALLGKTKAMKIQRDMRRRSPAPYPLVALGFAALALVSLSVAVPSGATAAGAPSNQAGPGLVSAFGPQGPGSGLGPGGPGPGGDRGGRGGGFGGRGGPPTSQPDRDRGGRGGSGRGGGMSRPPERPTDQQIDTAILILLETDPDLANRMMDARRSNPERVNTMFVEIWPKIAQTVELKDRDPEGFQLAMREIRYRRNIDELVKQYTAATAQTEREIFRKSLQDQVTELNKIRISMQLHMIDEQQKRMERQIDEQRQRAIWMTR
jgi:hypothetical protein